MSRDKARPRRKFFKQIDLTKGSIWKSILAFSLPILFSYLLQTMYGMADAAICGHTLTSSEVSGVGDTSPITFIFMQFAFGCTAGMSVMIADRVGKKDSEGIKKAFATQIILSVFIVVAVTLVSVFTIKPLLKLLGIAPSTDPVNNEVYEAAYTYLIIICGCMAGQYFYNVICCILRSLGDSVTPLIFLAVSSVLNIALDLLFIMVFDWGVAGAAAATVISQSLSAVSCFIYAVVRYKELRLKASDFKAFNFRTAMKTLWQGVPLGLQFSVLAFGLIVMQNGVISFDKLPSGEMVEGTPAQIGYGAACKLDNLFMTPFNALGTAMISFAAQNYGAGDYKRIQRGTLQCFYMMLVLSAFAVLAEFLLSINGAYQHIFLAGDKITSETIRYGNTYLCSVVPFFITLGALLLMRNVVQGLEKPLFPFLAGVGELVGRIVICLFLPALVNGAPIDANASAASFFWVGFGDAGAWILADLILLYPLIKYVILKKPTAEPAPEAEAETAVTEETDEK
ncbi:MAG: polysaccharide biosynthesis C-terminal domain-containing protein [Clostridia bacterium]|nr:polysaccharide biosynthesis C-terminal domain-containing protein [Clostridia bacterium]